MPALSEPVLIISASGRALAASARRGGISVVVLDLFNDVDTRKLAIASRACVNARGGFSGRKLREAAADFRPRTGYAACVIGSGLEGHPGILKSVIKSAPYAGNDPEAIAAVKDPIEFFGLLERLGIAHPEVRFAPPEDPSGWLSKRVGGAGGMHVRHVARGWPKGERRYLQRYQVGLVMSALFLANGRKVRCIGFNEQWPEMLSPRMPFAFGGAVSVCDLAPSVERAVVDIAQRLTQALALRGLNGLDFILEDDRVFVLELNARPVATLELHDHRVAGGLLRAHLAAIKGDLDVAITPPRHAQALGILWTGAEQLQVPLRSWPAWVSDIPMPESVIAPRRAVCTAHAQAPSAAQAKQQINERLALLRGQLWRQAA